MKTHCIHGHEMTGDNAYYSRGHGWRCRACKRESSRRRSDRQREGRGRNALYLPIAPFRAWLRAYLAQMDPDQMDGFAARAGWTADYVYRLASDRAARVELDTADRAFCAAGDPNLLNELYPLDEAVSFGPGYVTEEAA